MYSRGSDHTCNSIDMNPCAIVHVDGDAFFAACEVAREPKFRGKPVVVGGLRGIAVAFTYEAKARGITRGMPMFEIRRLCPEVIILPGDYEMYALYAERMYRIVRRYTPIVEEYSVDECFADITDMRHALKMSYEDIARKIKETLDLELGITFSVGLAPTKVLAKVASKHSKPSGLVSIPLSNIRPYLEKLPVGKVWGIGRATAEELYRFGIHTAWELSNKPFYWVQENLAKPHRNIWTELQGKSVHKVDTESHAEHKSVASTRTFRPPSDDKGFVFSQLSKNIEEACTRARRAGLAAKRVLCFLKSQEFQYLRFEVELVRHTHMQHEVVRAIKPLFERHFKQRVPWRATGVTLSDMRREEVEQGDLFGMDIEQNSLKKVYGAYDEVREKWGQGSIFLASSMGALKKVPNNIPHFSLPFLGDTQ